MVHNRQVSKTATFLTVDWEHDQEERLAAGLRPRLTASGYVRYVLPATSLIDAGWECYVLPGWEQDDAGRLVGKAWFENEHGESTFDCSVMVTQRWMDDWAAEKTARAVAAGQIVLADVDDHYWALPIDNPAYLNSHPDHRRDVNIEHYWRQLNACSGVIASTVKLQTYLSKLDVPVYLRRNMMDMETWEFRDTTLTGNRPRVGWTGGTAWRTRDLTICSGGEIGKFVNRHRLEFAHVGDWEGAAKAGDLLGINPEFQVYQDRFCTLEDYPEAVEKAEIDLGIIPMENSAFNHGKSCLKGMEFAAMGIPFVAAAMPEYEWLGIGILAKTPRDWKRGLEKMLDPEQRCIYATAGLERVKQEDYRLKGREYVELFDSLVS